MAAPPVTCVMHVRVPGPEAYTKAVEKDKTVRVVPTFSEAVPADFILSTGGISVAFIVSNSGTLAPDVAARAAKMDASFRTSFVVSLSGELGAAESWAHSPPRRIALSGNTGDAMHFMLATARNLAAFTRPVERPVPAPPTAAALVDAVAALPGVPSKGAATALLCAAGTLADLACAPPSALAAIGSLSPSQGEALAALFQQPSQLMMPAAVAYKVT